MNATAAALAAVSGTQATARASVSNCYHCGEAIVESAILRRIGEAQREFCCEGCAAATEWILNADLADYYHLRQETANRVPLDDRDLQAWDRDEVLAEHARDVPGGREITLIANGMRCAACAWLIDRALTREVGVLEVSANAVTGRLRLAWDPQRTPLLPLLKRLQSLGYRPCLATGAAREQSSRRERQRWLLRLGIAGLGAMQTMMFADALNWGDGAMSLPMRDFLRWITLLVSTPVVFFAGWPFLLGCWRELQQRRLGMDTLIATSTLLAYFASLVETVRGGAHVWYDAAAMFVFLLLLARALEDRVRRLATAQVDALARARPVFATRETAAGSLESVPLGALAAGDIVRVPIGETVPADARLLDENASFEESLLTGEANPVHKSPGDAVFAGTICRERPARLRVCETGAATRLSQLVRLVEQAQSHRPALAAGADRVAKVFVTTLLLVAVLVFLAWRVQNPERAFEVTLALLVISCPCALSLAVPAALAAANSALARLGVLPARPDALERLAGVSDLVFDKTGTLSDGQPALVDVQAIAPFDREQVLDIAAALERDSTHPLAGMFVRAAGGALVARDVVAHPGHGIEGIVADRAWRLGQASFAAPADDDGAVWLGDGHRAIARFVLADRLRPDAASTFDALRTRQLTLHIVSGDAAEAVRRIAASLRPQQAHARQTPEAKLAYVRRLQANGRRVAMIGDGLNDAPVLAAADVSIAMGEGAALAQQAADLVLTSPALARIPQAIDLARRTRRIVRQNFAWAVAYNLIALPLAAAGLVTPWLAAIGMTLSSLTVTLNALRLSRATKSADGLPAKSPRKEWLEVET